MDEKVKYKTKIEARLVKFGETLYEIAEKKEKRNENRPDLDDLGDIVRKHAEATARVNILDTVDDNAWQDVKAEVDQLVNDIDEDLRKAMAHFK
jgi:hypothetical protein